jgi:hypothetical protein
MIVPQEPKMSKRAKIIQATIMVTIMVTSFVFVLISHVLISATRQPQTETIAPVFNIIYYIILPIFVGAIVLAVVIGIILYIRA